MLNSSSFLNFIIASILLRNSGLKNSFTSLSSSPVRSKDWLNPMLLNSFALAPKLDVNIIIVLAMLTVLPELLVILPSSSICSNMLLTSGCAFSISSNKIIANGFLLKSDIN